MKKRQEFLNLIKGNILKNGFHITLVQGGQTPNFAYTIGLSEKMGFELLLAGGFVSIEGYEETFETVIEVLKSENISDLVYPENRIIANEYKLLNVHVTWKEKIILGVYDFYNTNSAKALQIVPVNNLLLDVPDMSQPWQSVNPIWKWLGEKWDESIPKSAHVVTNVQFLLGENITEVMRWKEDYWEMFTNNPDDIPDEEVRIIPLGTAIGIDDSLKAAMDLKINEGIWRESRGESWQEWL